MWLGGVSGRLLWQDGVVISTLCFRDCNALRLEGRANKEQLRQQGRNQNERGTYHGGDDPSIVLPNYVDSLLCSDSRQAVDRHLAGCSACSCVLASMRETEPEAAEQDREVDYLKRVKLRNNRRVIAAVFSVFPSTSPISRKLRFPKARR